MYFHSFELRDKNTEWLTVKWISGMVEGLTLTLLGSELQYDYWYWFSPTPRVCSRQQYPISTFPGLTPYFAANAQNVSSTQRGQQPRQEDTNRRKLLFHSQKTNPEIAYLFTDRHEVYTHTHTQQEN